MDARTRVRQFLARGPADRAPFLGMATEDTARLALGWLGWGNVGPASLIWSVAPSGCERGRPAASGR